MITSARLPVEAGSTSNLAEAVPGEANWMSMRLWTGDDTPDTYLLVDLVRNLSGIVMCPANREHQFQLCVGSGAEAGDTGQASTSKTVQSESARL